ncbi:hypothetical protein BKA62DRAFT_680818 [Auriculariales sp. MPI-PUGE-AT-0066]|nr:hypothetical protein BKA62DRAFT_680818 [Auriculariales sp. MPI-PUGE-AT-0066]
MATLTAAELQRRRELEGAPDPFPSLPGADNVERIPRVVNGGGSGRGPSPAVPSAALDTGDSNEFPALAPTQRPPSSAPASKPGTPAPGWGQGGPRISAPVSRLISDTFELDQIDLSTAGKDGKRATGLSEVFRNVSQKFKVKCEASSQPSGYTSFTLKADSQKELDKARKLLISLISPRIELIVKAPSSTIPAIIGPKGAFLKQIRDETGAKIDIPPRDTAAIAAAAAAPNGKAKLADSDDEEEETVDITITAAGAYAREAKRLIEEVISARTAKTTQRVKDIPPHVLPFISGRKTDFESLADGQEVSVSIDGPIVYVSGQREGVSKVIEGIKAGVEDLKSSLTSIKMPMPKRQHRLLTGKAAEEILNKSKCSVQVPKADSDIEEIALWARPSDLPGALAAVQQAATSQHIQTYKFPGKHAQAVQIFTYLSRTGFSKDVTKAHPGVTLHAPTPKDLQKEPIVIDIIGDKPAAEAASKQIAEAATKLVGATRDVEIDYLVHRAIEGKYAKKIKAFKDTQRISIFWPAESTESSKVLIVYDISADPANKAASLDEVAKELLKFAKEVADVKTEVVLVDEKWHAAIKGKNGTTLNALIGVDSTLAIKLGTDAAKFLPAGQTATAQTIAVRGVAADVARAIKDINRIVEEAKNDEIDNSYSIDFQIAQEYVGRIVGSQGAAVNRLREQLGIEVDFTDENGDSKAKDNKDKDKDIAVKKKKTGAATGAKARVTLKGRKENVEEGRKRIIAQVERLADETSEVLKIPRQYHAALIGRGAKYVVRLEERYGVKVTFPRESDENGERTTREQLKSDEVLVKGGKKGVADAKKELLDGVEYEKDNNNQIKFTVPTRSVPRILGKAGANINEIKDTTGAQIDVDKAEESSGDVTNISVRGNKEAIQEAKALILKIASEVGDEVTEKVTIPHRFHRTIIGARGAGLRDLLAKCGAPTDPRAQAGLCHFPRQGEVSDDVTLRGSKTVVAKVKAELKKIVEDLSDRVVVGVDIPAVQHKNLIGRGGNTLDALQKKHDVQVQFPGSRSYDGLGALDNEADLKEVEPANLVKVSGRKKACEAAIKDMQASVKAAPPERSAPSGHASATTVTDTIEVPVKYHHAVSQGGQFFRNLRNYGVNVDHSVVPPKATPSRPTAAAASARIDADEADAGNGIGWELGTNYADAEDTISTWTLKARDQAGLDKAKAAVEEALKNAEAMSHVGFLTVPDRTIFPRIIGSKGANVQRLRAESGAEITVGKDDNIITLQGTETAVLAAKDMITEIINNANRPRGGPRNDRRERD